MPQGMRLRRTLIQKVALSAASFVVAVAASAPVGQFFIALADERGWYQNPSSRLAAMMDIVATVASSSWFHWIGGTIVGFSIGVWLDFLLKRKDVFSTATPAKSHEILKLSDLPASASPILLRLQFSGSRGISPIELRSENILGWYVIWTAETIVTFENDAGASAGGFQVPKTWSFFVIFDKPAIFRQLIVQFSHPDKVGFEIKCSTSYFAIITSNNDVPSGILDIYSAE